MKRDNFIALVWGVAAGLLLGLADLIWRRKKAGKPPLRLSGKSLGVGALAVAGALTLGLGMCLSMVWNQLVWGCVLGALGILVLLLLIPLTKGLRE